MRKRPPVWTSPSSQKCPSSGCRACSCQLTTRSTTSQYVDKTCPQKLQFDDQQWVGLYQCGSSGNFTDWGGCENSPADLSTLVKNPLASCTPYCSSALLVGSSQLAAYAVSLKSSINLSYLEFFCGNGFVDSRDRPCHLLWEDRSHGQIASILHRPVGHQGAHQIRLTQSAHHLHPTMVFLQEQRRE